MTKQNDKQVKVVQGTARSAVRAIHDRSDQAQAEINRTLQELARLRSESPTQRQFREALLRAGFDKSQLRQVIAVMDGRASIQDSLFRELAKVPAERVSTERLTMALNHYLASPDCRRELNRPLETSADAASRLPEHEFAPFIASICTPTVLSNVRAETLARLSVYVRSNHAAQDFGLVVSDQPSVTAMREVLTRLRAGEPVAGPELEKVLDQRFAELFEPIKVVACPQTGLPVAVQARHSSYAGRVSADSPRGSAEGSGMVDAFLRDALDPRRIHIAAATSNEDTSSQRDQLARHPTAIRNSIEMGLPPFSTSDELGSMSFINQAMLTDQRVKQLTGNVKGWSASDREAVESLALYAMLGHQAINPLQVDLTHILRFNHQPVGAVSGARGGQEPSIERLISHASAQFARSAQALSKMKLPAEEGVKGVAEVLLNRLYDAGFGLAKRLPKDAEHGLRQALPALRKLTDLESAGMDLLGEKFAALVAKIENIGPAERERQVPTGARIPSEVHAASRQELLVKQDRAQVVQFIQQGSAWSQGIENRWVQARDQASPKVWEALLRQDVPLYALDARYNNGQAVLDMTPHQQGSWMKHYAAAHPQRQLDQVVDTVAQQGAAARYFVRQEQADRLRLNLSDLRGQDLLNLNEIQMRAAAPLWNGVVNQVFTLDEVMHATNAHGTPLLESSEPTQAKWANDRIQACLESVPTPQPSTPEPRSSKVSKPRRR